MTPLGRERSVAPRRRGRFEAHRAPARAGSWGLRFTDRGADSSVAGPVKFSDPGPARRRGRRLASGGPRETAATFPRTSDIMTTLNNPNQHVRLVRPARPAPSGSPMFGGWGPRVPGL